MKDFVLQPDALALPDLLTVEQVQVLKSEVDELKTRSAALARIGELMVERIVPQEYRDQGMTLTFALPDDSAERAELGKALGNVLAALVRAQLVSERNTAKLTALLESGSLAHPVLLVGAAGECAGDDEWWNPTTTLTFAELLRSQDLVDDEALGRIKEECAAAGLPTPAELLRYLKHARLMDLRSYAGEPADFLPAIFRDAASIHPALAFESFSYETMIQRHSDTVAMRKYRITLETARGPYSHEISAGTTNEDAATNHVWSKDLPKIFNKMLADAGVPARMHVVEFRRPDIPVAPDYVRFGLVILSQPQVEALAPLHQHFRGGLAYFPVAYEDFATVGPAAFSHALTRYRALGLLDHLAPGETRAIEEKARREHVPSMNHLLLQIPGLVAEWVPDGAEGAHPYADVLHLLASVSRGHFAPKEIVDTFAADEPHVQFGFTLAGRKYSAVLDRHNDWYDEAAWALIKRAVEETDRHGRFDLLETGNGVPLIYLTRAQHEALSAESLATFAAESKYP
jgi:hypothetical protein